MNIDRFVRFFLVFSAKMDATENDVPSQYQVRGFPTIFFAPKNNKENPKKYEVRSNRKLKANQKSLCVYLGWPRSQ